MKTTIKSSKIILALSVMILLVGFPKLQAAVIGNNVECSEGLISIVGGGDILEKEAPLDEPEFFDEVQIQNVEKGLDLSELFSVKTVITDEVIEDEEAFNEEEMRKLASKLKTELLFNS